MRRLVRIERGTIERTELERALSSDGCGAEVSFFGIVRDKNVGRQVTAITYEVFEPLALRILDEISAEAEARWGSELRCAIIHRAGYVPVGQASVGLGAALPHRDESFAACRFLIEQVKHRAPIWKLEHYADGGSSWLPGCCIVPPPAPV